jgi:PAS domain S-box-containing protein
VKTPAAILRVDARKVLDSFADPVIVSDASDRILYANVAVETLLGWPVHELVDKPLVTIMPERMRAAHSAGLERYMRTRVPRLIGRPVRVPALRRDGTEIEVELTLAVLRGDNGRDLVVGSFRDLRDRIELERQLAIGDWLRAATAIAARLTERLDMTSVLSVAVNTWTEMLGASFARLWRFDPFEGVLRLAASAGHTSDPVATSRVAIDIGNDETKVAIVARTRVPFVSNALAEETGFDGAWIARERLVAAAVFPLVIGGELRGVMTGFFRQRLEREFVDVLSTIAAMISAAINDVQLFEREQIARADAERVAKEIQRNEATQRFLARASTLLGASLEYRTVLGSIAQLCVPEIADRVAVDTADAGGNLQRVAALDLDVLTGRVVDPQPTAALPRSDAAILRGVLRTGIPAVLLDLEHALEDTPEHRSLRSMGLSSFVCVPIRSRYGIGGTISVATTASSTRRLDGRDVRLCEELAWRAGVAIDNATSLREAQEASQLKDEFLATLSHELRTPLTAVLGWAAILRAHRGDPTSLEKGINAIERNARAQAQLIDDLLDVSRAIRGKLRLQLKRTQIVPIVEAALETVRPAATAKEIQLETHFDEAIPPVMGDPDRLLQVANNLLGNAVKFTPPGGTVRATVRRSQSAIELAVEDTGEGIDPTFLPHVFERFRQADGRSTRAHGGLGLGLAICKSLVEMQGGRIEARSGGKGLGATFVVRLPVATSAAMPRPTTGAHPKPPQAIKPPAALHGARVLCVEDDVDTRELLLTVLAERQANATAVDGADAALRQLGERHYDLLVSDLGMPKRDGYDLIRAVRELPPERGGAIPAVALTAYASDADRARALDAGFDAFVAKPIDVHRLAEVLSGLLARAAPA